VLPGRRDERVVRRRATGWALLVGAAAGGVAMGYLAERRLMGAQRAGDDPEWEELQRPLAGEQRTVTSWDGTRLRVWVRGPDGAPTLVFVHGYGLGAKAWQHQLRDLSQEFRVVAYDQRGHGASGSARDRDHTIEALGRDLHAVLDAVCGADERVVVVGHSMGGMTVMAYAEGHPADVGRRLSGAALLSTGSSRLLTGSAFSTGIAALGAIEERVGGRLLGRRVPGGQLTNDLSFLLTRAIGLHPDAPPAQVAFVEQLLIDMPNTSRAGFAQVLGSLDLSTALANLTVPTLVMVGSRDRLTPVRQAWALTEQLPDATYLEVPGVGHHLPLEAHAPVTAALREHARRCFS
jgi:pimeloyl-ACP methyl ester carboxylesterase